MSIVVRHLDVQRDGSDEVETLAIAPRTVMAWEKERSNRSAVQLEGNALRVQYFYELAWIALDKPGGDFDKFCATTDVWASAEAPAEADPVDPTRPEASTTN